QVFQRIDRLSRLYPSFVLEQLLFLAPLKEEELKDPAAVAQWCQRLADRLLERGVSSERYEISVFEDKERRLHFPSIMHMAHGVPHEYTLSREFILSEDYNAIVALGGRLQGLLEE